MNSTLSARLRSWLASRPWWSRVADALKVALVSRRPAPNPHAQEIAAEQIRLLYDQLPSALIASVVIGALAAYVLWNRVPHWALVLWLAALGVLTIARVGLRRRYVRAKPLPRDSAVWARPFVLGTASAGVIWGLAGLFPFNGGSLFHEMFIAFILAGLSAGGTLRSRRSAAALRERTQELAQANIVLSHQATHDHSLTRLDE